MGILKCFGILLCITLVSNGLTLDSKIRTQVEPVVRLYCQPNFKGITLIIDPSSIIEDNCYDVSNIFPGCDIGSIDINPGYCASLYRTSCGDTVAARVSSLTPWLNDIHSSFLGNLGAFKFSKCDDAELSVCKTKLTSCMENEKNITDTNTQLSKQIESAQKQASSTQSLLNSCQQDVASTQSALDSSLKQLAIAQDQFNTSESEKVDQIVLLKKENEKAQAEIADKKRETNETQSALAGARVESIAVKIKLTKCQADINAVENINVSLRNKSQILSEELTTCRNESMQGRQEISTLQTQLNTANGLTGACLERATNIENEVIVCKKQIASTISQIADFETNSTSTLNDLLACTNLAEYTRAKLATLEAQLTHANSQSRKCLDEIVNIQNKLMSSQSDTAQAKAKLSNLENQLADSKNQCQASAQLASTTQQQLTGKLKEADAALQISRQETLTAKTQAAASQKKTEDVEAKYRQMRNIACKNYKQLYTAQSCEHHATSLHCSDQRIITVKDAAYGRTDRTTCGSHLSSNTNCKAASSLGVVSNSCNGKNSCQVSASNSVFGDPCYGTYKYLTVSYTCGSSEVDSICS